MLQLPHEESGPGLLPDRGIPLQENGNIQQETTPQGGMTLHEGSILPEETHRIEE